MGLVLDAQEVFSERLGGLSELMVSAVVGKTLINELVTPFLLRFCLFRTGEAYAAEDGEK